MEQLIKKVSLENVRFFAYHGVYPEEQLVGNEFLLNIETQMKALPDEEDDLSFTINYERLYEIASAEMQHTRKLIETVAVAILKKTSAEFPFVDRIKISIRKMHLPLGGEVGNSLVEYTYTR